MSVRKIAVVGAGLMGRGIAYAAALGGLRTVVQDTDPKALQKMTDDVSALLERGVAMGRIEGHEAVAAHERLSAARTLEDAAKDAELVIEAVPEDLRLKLEVFAQLDRAAPREAVLASNTASLSVTELAAATSRPARVVGMHFSPPVPRMKLLEVVRGLETSDETIAVATAVGEAMGKECVVVRESPGLVTSRLSALLANEAFYLLQEGVASARDIDRAMKLGLNHPLGPLELADLAGLDSRLSLLRLLHRRLGEKFRPCPLLEQYVAGGRLGRKSGRGVYEYEEP